MSPMNHRIRDITTVAALLIAFWAGTVSVDRSDVTEPAASIALDIAETTHKVSGVWNRVNVPDMKAAVAGSAGPGGHIKLHLEGISAIPNIDNVLVALRWTVPGDDNSPAPILMEAAQWTLASEGFSGDMVWDVTDALAPIFDQTQLSPTEVVYHITQRNHSVQLNDASFAVDWTYFEIFDAAGNPVLQERRPKPANDVATAP